MRFALPHRVSRVAVGLAGVVTLALTGSVIYLRAGAGEPMRIARDADGVVRWVSRADAMAAKVAEAEARLAALPPGAPARERSSFEASLRAWRRALEAERARAGVEVGGGGGDAGGGGGGAPPPPGGGGGGRRRRRGRRGRRGARDSGGGRERPRRQRRPDTLSRCPHQYLWERRAGMQPSSKISVEGSDLDSRSLRSARFEQFFPVFTVTDELPLCSECSLSYSSALNYRAH
jgi:hypothetical protein